jgi:hypothetical protein
MRTQKYASLWWSESLGAPTLLFSARNPDFSGIINRLASAADLGIKAHATCCAMRAATSGIDHVVGFNKLISASSRITGAMDSPGQFKMLLLAYLPRRRRVQRHHPLNIGLC